MHLTSFKVLTFDCYGTLIDWETGLFRALAPLLERVGEGVSRGEVLEAFGEAEAEQEAATPAMLYPRILAAAHERLAARWGVEVPGEWHERFGGSVPEWPAFADSPAALRYLKEHYKLVILSNVDRASFRASNERLGVEFDAVYTAEEIGSYKPAPRNFEFLVERVRTDLGCAKHEILHTAQSLFHDHLPAKALELATAWIDRRRGQGGSGATPMPAEVPEVDFHFPSMEAMAAAHRSTPFR